MRCEGEGVVEQMWDMRPEGFEPPITGPKPVVISISLRARNFLNPSTQGAGTQRNRFPSYGKLPTGAMGNLPIHGYPGR